MNDHIIFVYHNKFHFLKSEIKIKIEKESEIYNLVSELSEKNYNFRFYLNKKYFDKSKIIKLSKSISYLDNHFDNQNDLNNYLKKFKTNYA